MQTHQTPLQNVRGVIFDMDGTLVVSDLDFQLIRAEAGVPDEMAILEYLASADSPRRETVRRVLLRHERRAARTCRLVPGAQNVLNALRGSGYRLALLTRNSRESVDHVLSRFELEFDVTVSREDATPKPAPDPVLKIAKRFQLPASDLLVVGDYLFDVEAGRAAGARTALLRTERTTAFLDRADIALDELTDLMGHLPLRDPQLTETP
jgi:HAD superfamily hydrolase (TIGR01509 family)